jgi:hypothetical protein
MKRDLWPFEYGSLAPDELESIGVKAPAVFPGESSSGI